MAAVMVMATTAAAAPNPTRHLPASLPAESDASQQIDDGPIVHDRRTSRLQSLDSSTRTQSLAPSDNVQLAGLLPIPPARLLDTRVAIGAPTNDKVGTDATIVLSIAGREGLPATGLDAVALNVTVVEATAPSFVTVWPADAPRPDASSLNMIPGQVIPNLVITKVGADGTIKLYNAFGATHIIADVIGYSVAPEFYTSLVPDRILDTRTGNGAPVGALGPNATIDLQVAGRGGVPASGADAVVFNLTVTQPTAPSFVTVWPTGATKPTASSINMMPGDTFPNLAISKIGANGKISLFNAFGYTHVIADVVGWIPRNGAYTAINPTRILDTRTLEGQYGTPHTFEIEGTTFEMLRPPWGPVGAGQTIMVDTSTIDSLPDAATAVVVNLTVTEPTQSTHVTAWAYPDAMPATSTLNAGPWQTIPNLAVVEIGANGWISLSNAFGSAHLIADVVGYFTSRNVANHLDDGNKIHLVHLVPSDRQPSFDRADIIKTVDVAESWLEAQRGKGFNLDTYRGQVEVTTVRIPERLAELNTMGNSELGRVLNARLIADGLDGAGNTFMTFVDGLANAQGSCGIASSWSHRPENNGYIFTGTCYPEISGSAPSVEATWETSRAARVFLHELLHTLSAVSLCAPNAYSGGHVSEPADIMHYADTISFDGKLLSGAEVVDVGDDDYWGIGPNRVCYDEPWPDVSLSRFLGAPD